jgi:hypothetical protein
MMDFFNILEKCIKFLFFIGIFCVIILIFIVNNSHYKRYSDEKKLERFKSKIFYGNVKEIIFDENDHNRHKIILVNGKKIDLTFIKNKNIICDKIKQGDLIIKNRNSEYIIIVTNNLKDSLKVIY